ncbi:hypothetical protein A0130_13545 [Leifsonia xyli]|nr:hypothetical protein A0130_13545 [Leifsonia xyli]
MHAAAPRTAAATAMPTPMPAATAPTLCQVFPDQENGFHQSSFFFADERFDDDFVFDPVADCLGLVLPAGAAFVFAFVLDFGVDFCFDGFNPDGSDRVTGELWEYEYPLDCAGSAASSTGSTDRNRPAAGSYARAPNWVSPVTALVGAFKNPCVDPHDTAPPRGFPNGSEKRRVTFPSAAATERSCVCCRSPEIQVRVEPVVPAFAQHDEWDGTGRRYFSEHSMAQLTSEPEEATIPELAAA